LPTVNNKVEDIKIVLPPEIRQIFMAWIFKVIFPCSFNPSL
jgi:hypothetical protein